MSYYPNVIFYMIRPFGLECCTIGVFFKKMAFLNVNYHFVYMMKIHKHEISIFNREIYAQHHTIWSGKNISSRDDVFTVLYIMKVRIDCLLEMFVDVGIDMLFNISIKRLHVCHIYN